MKLKLLTGAACFLMIGACTHMDQKSDDGMNKTSNEKQESTCVPPPGQDKCKTGGGVTGPILND